MCVCLSVCGFTSPCLMHPLQALFSNHAMKTPAVREKHVLSIQNAQMGESVFPIYVSQVGCGRKRSPARMSTAAGSLLPRPLTNPLPSLPAPLLSPHLPSSLLPPLSPLPPLPSPPSLPLPPLSPLPPLPSPLSPPSPPLPPPPSPPLPPLPSLPSPPLPSLPLPSL